MIAAAVLVLLMPAPGCAAVDPLANVATWPGGRATYHDTGDGLVWSRPIPPLVEALATGERGRSVRARCER